MNNQGHSEQKKQKKEKEQTKLRDKNKRLTMILVATAIGMFGFSYLLVPIFTFVCRQTGINGKAANYASIAPANMQVDLSRTIKVELNTILHNGLDFNFRPEKRWVNIHPGERKLLYFYAQNNMGQDMTVQAVPSITPADAAAYLRKTECFCFTQQFFAKGEKAAMPVLFYIEPTISKNIKEMTLSYTLFDARPFIKKGQKQFTKGRIKLSS